MKKIYAVLLVGIIFLIAFLSYENIKAVSGSIYKTVWQYEGKANEYVLKDTKTIKKASKESADTLTLYAMSACLMDASSGRVLYSKDAYNKMPMASTTKIMTLLIVLENADLNSIVTVSANAARQPDVQLNIREGEKYRLKDLLYSLMLESHNDSAVAIAEHVGGSVEGFCAMMNSKAKSIGAYNTNFVTPNGLDAEGHYTTAADLALIASYAVKNKEFIKITNTSTYTFNEIDNKRSFTVSNKNRFLSMLEGANGIKTGFTGRAGYCFAGSVVSDDKHLVSVVLACGWPPNKNYKWSDTLKLMKYGLNNFKNTKIFNESGIIDTVNVAGGTFEKVEIEIEKNAEYSALLSDNDNAEAVYYYPDVVTAPVISGSKAGYVEIMINDKSVKKFKLKYAEDVPKQDLNECIYDIFDIIFK